MGLVWVYSAGGNSLTWLLLQLSSVQPASSQRTGPGKFGVIKFPQGSHYQTIQPSPSRRWPEGAKNLPTQKLNPKNERRKLQYTSQIKP